MSISINERVRAVEVHVDGMNGQLKSIQEITEGIKEDVRQINETIMLITKNYKFGLWMLGAGVVIGILLDNPSLWAFLKGFMH